MRKTIDSYRAVDIATDAQVLKGGARSKVDLQQSLPTRENTVFAESFNGRETIESVLKGAGLIAKNDRG